MGFFDFFKRNKSKNVSDNHQDDIKTVVPIEPEVAHESVATEESKPDFKDSEVYQNAVKSIKASNEFEDLLNNAADNPELRSEFYKRLLNSQLLIITENNNSAEGEKQIPANTNVQIASLNTGAIPVFTSIPRIFDKGIIKNDVSYTQLSGKDLFELTKGNTLFVNPFSDYGKELLPGEIERILDGTIFGDSLPNNSISEGQTIQIGTPKVLPTQAMEEMCKYFKTDDTVKSAYVAWINIPGSNEPAHYIFALDISGDYRKIVPNAGEIFEKYSDKSSFADFIKLEPKGGLSEYFIHQATPFYSRD